MPSSSILALLAFVCLAFAASAVVANDAKKDCHACIVTTAFIRADKHPRDLIIATCQVFGGSKLMCDNILEHATSPFLYDTNHTDNEVCMSIGVCLQPVPRATEAPLVTEQPVALAPSVVAPAPVTPVAPSAPVTSTTPVNSVPAVVTTPVVLSTPAEPVLTPVASESLCEACKMVSNVAKEAVSANTTIVAAEAVIKVMCMAFNDGALSSDCQEVISSIGPIMRDVQTGLNSMDVCKHLNMCPATATVQTEEEQYVETKPSEEEEDVGQTLTPSPSSSPIRFRVLFFRRFGMSEDEETPSANKVEAEDVTNYEGENEHPTPEIFIRRTFVRALPILPNLITNTFRACQQRETQGEIVNPLQELFSKIFNLGDNTLEGKDEGAPTEADEGTEEDLKQQEKEIIKTPGYLLPEYKPQSLPPFPLFPMFPSPFFRRPLFPMTTPIAGEDDDTSNNEEQPEVVSPTDEETVAQWEKRHILAEVKTEEAFNDLEALQQEEEKLAEENDAVTQDLSDLENEGQLIEAANAQLVEQIKKEDVSASQPVPHNEKRSHRPGDGTVTESKQQPQNPFRGVWDKIMDTARALW